MKQRGGGIFKIVMFSRIRGLGVKFNIVIVMLEGAGKRLTKVNHENRVLQGPKLGTAIF